MHATRPKVLFVYYTYTEQTLKVVEAMSEALRERGCEVQQAQIDLTDKRYTARFHQFPMPHAFREVVAMIPAEILRKTGEISIPDEARGGDYDLVCIGSPTWWLSTDLPIRSYLESDDAGTLLNGRRFAAFVGEYRDRYLGVPIPPTNIQEYHLKEARAFANGLADQLGAATPSSGNPQPSGTAGESTQPSP